jgi:hypothetical protein
LSLKPPKYVGTVRELIYWYYADLIARAAGFDNNYGFVVSRYKLLKSGKMKWSPSHRDFQKSLELGNVCVYCGSAQSISMDHIIPISRAGVDPRVICLLDSVDNIIQSCKKCNSSKGDRDAFEWYGRDRLDDIPKLVLSKFLKMAYELHETQGTLDLGDMNFDGVLDIFDLGVVITNLISKMSGQVQSPLDSEKKRKFRERI